MNPLDKKHTILATTLLSTSLFISILAVILFPQEQSRRVLFFPDGVTGELGGEEHLVPRRSDRQAAIEEFLEELILGPITLGAVRVFPAETEIALLMLREKELYIDFSPEILDLEEETNTSFDDALEMTKYNLRYNFPFLRSITVTVSGQLPGEARFDLSRMGNNR
ncbi:MAG: GerMN domain-containing protein [Alkalispirochaetaceae bacterium]